VRIKAIFFPMDGPLPQDRQIDQVNGKTRCFGTINKHEWYWKVVTIHIGYWKWSNLEVSLKRKEMKLENIGPVMDFNGSFFFFTVRHVNGLSRRLQWKGRCLYNTYIPTRTQTYKHSFLKKIRNLKTPMKDSIEEKSTLYIKKKNCDTKKWIDPWKQIFLKITN